jgi:hypothetical protein
MAVLAALAPAGLVNIHQANLSAAAWAPICFNSSCERTFSMDENWLKFGEAMHDVACLQVWMMKIEEHAQTVHNLKDSFLDHPTRTSPSFSHVHSSCKERDCLLRGPEQGHMRQS